VLDRLTVVTKLDQLADRDLVIEAISEREQLKVELLRDLDRIVSSTDAVLASNTSSIPIMKLAVATSRQKAWWASTPCQS
jgi:3-hydroxybutyryl-CoA dehydrogenase